MNYVVQTSVVLRAVHLRKLAITLIGQHDPLNQTKTGIC